MGCTYPRRHYIEKSWLLLNNEYYYLSFVCFSIYSSEADAALQSAITATPIKQPTNKPITKPIINCSPLLNLLLTAINKIFRAYLIRDYIISDFKEVELIENLYAMQNSSILG